MNRLAARWKEADGLAAALGNSISDKSGRPVPLIPHGEPIRDESFLMLFNAHPEPIAFVIPDGLGGNGWLVELDTSTDANHGLEISNSEAWEIGPWAVVLLRQLERQDDK